MGHQKLINILFITNDRHFYHYKSVHRRLYGTFSQKLKNLQIFDFFQKSHMSSTLKRLTITIFILSAKSYLNKTRLTSSKNIDQVTNLIEPNNASLDKVIIYNLREYFTVFRSILLRFALCAFDQFFEHITLHFCLLIVQRDLVILFIFDAVNLN